MNHIPKRDRSLQSVSVYAEAEAQAFVVRFTAGKVIKQLGPFTLAEATEKRDTLKAAGVDLDHKPQQGILNGIGPIYGYSPDAFHTPNPDQFGFGDPDWFLRDTVIRHATAIAHARTIGYDPDSRHFIAAAKAIGSVPSGPRRDRLREVYVCLTEGTGAGSAGSKTRQKVSA